MAHNNPERQYFMGVDGGQTTTLTLLLTQDGEILSGALTGPCNHIHEPGGIERQYRTLRTGYEQAFAGAGLPVCPLTGAFLGLSGHGSPEVVARVYDTQRLDLEGDTITALAGAIPDMVGTIIISGTGSIARGRNHRGQEAITGGQGYFAGDEGSGYDIARRGIQAIFQAADGRNPPTMLTDLILQWFACADLKQLHRKIYSTELMRADLARAAQLVGQASAAGDAVALQILKEAGFELGRLVAAVLTRLDLTSTATPIAPIGGVFKAGELITGPMLEKIHQTNPDAYTVTPQFIPAIGAGLLALRAAGIVIDKRVIANLERTKHRIPD
jgi:N-acetylglucosamine kinase-like BadF-type ATPase